MRVNQLSHSPHQLPLNRSKLSISVMIMGSDLHFCKRLQGLLEVYNLSLSGQFKIVGKANSSQSALSIFTQFQPALIFIDWDSFQEPDEAIKMIKIFSQWFEKNQYSSKILVLSSLGEESSIFYAMQSGACGYLLKENLPMQLSIAITTALNNQVYLCPEVAARFFHFFQIYQEQSASIQPIEPLHPLTESHHFQSYNLTNREREVLKLLVEGYRNQEIARSLHITVATVKAHLTTIFEKLGVDSRSRAIVRSLHLGLLEEKGEKQSRCINRD